MLTRIRLKYGLMWRSIRPSLRDAKTLIDASFVVAFIVIVLGLVSKLEEQTELRIAATEAAEIYAASAKVLVACESGEASGYHYPSGRAYECVKPLF